MVVFFSFIPAIKRQGYFERVEGYLGRSIFFLIDRGRSKRRWLERFIKRIVLIDVLITVLISAKEIIERWRWKKGGVNSVSIAWRYTRIKRFARFVGFNINIEFLRSLRFLFSLPICFFLFLFFFFAVMRERKCWRWDTCRTAVTLARFNWTVTCNCAIISSNRIEVWNESIASKCKIYLSVGHRCPIHPVVTYNRSIFRRNVDHSRNYIVSRFEKIPKIILWIEFC